VVRSRRARLALPTLKSMPSENRLNELPPFRERGPAGEGRRHAGTINLRDDADRADDMPDEPATAGDHKGAAVWRRVAGAAETLANTTPSGPVH
jgi:hypothetical protein